MLQSIIDGDAMKSIKKEYPTGNGRREMEDESDESQKLGVGKHLTEILDVQKSFKGQSLVVNDAGQPPVKHFKGG